jgi:hypothetical protein
MNITTADEDLVDDVMKLYKMRNWREITDRYHNHPARNKLLWVYPSVDNFQFMKNCLGSLGCDNVLSIGCGCGLLEWMTTEATGDSLILPRLRRSFTVLMLCLCDKSKKIQIAK